MGKPFKFSDHKDKKGHLDKTATAYLGKAQHTQKVMVLTKEERQDQAACMYLKGMTQWEIGRVLKISQQQVSVDLATIRDRWKQWSVEAFDAKLEREVAKIDRLEMVYWQRFEISCRCRKDEDGEEIEQPGDIRWLDAVMKCIEMRLKLMGAFKENNTTVNQLFLQWDQMYERQHVHDPLQLEIDKLRQVNGIGQEIIDAKEGNGDEVAPLRSSDEVEEPQLTYRDGEFEEAMEELQRHTGQSSPKPSSSKGNGSKPNKKGKK